MTIRFTSPSTQSSATPLVRPLHDFLQRVERPIDFALRDQGSHLSSIKNLGPFISSQIIEALSAGVYSPLVEGRLLDLRQLFVDFHAGLSPAEQLRRLARARMILASLRAGSLEDTPKEGQVKPGRRTPESVGHLQASLDVKTLAIRYAKGVGPKRAALLERLGVKTVEDAFWCLPWRYEDRSVITPIARVVPGGEATVCGVIVASQLRGARYKRLTVLEVTVQDRTGRLQAVFFNQPYLEKVLAVGSRIMLAGRVLAGRGGWMELRMDVDEYEVLGEETDGTVHVGRIVPIYHETKGWTSRQMRVLVKDLIEEYLPGLEEALPVQVRAKYHLCPIQQAVAEVHFPVAGTDLAALDRGVTAAHRRLAFEELFLLQVALASRQRAVKCEVKGIQFDPATSLLARLGKALPFRLTTAQERAWMEIRQDMASHRPMNRLIQGDVGSGKTVVALHAIVMACGSGYQAALMAPTEILAEQHGYTLRGFLEQLGLSVAVLTGSGGARQRAALLTKIETGQIQVVIGTHALIQRGVKFAKLGLAVIDEQHRFGVLQRKSLIDKGYRPDVLVLTATPIPRTLAMTVYGDLDVSMIDALPPGRKPVKTLLFAESQRCRAYRIVKDHVEAGCQAFIVYPLVEESEKTDLQAAIQAAERLRQEEFRHVTVGLLHGRLRSVEKERTMAAFKAGKINVLVATTIIEVGMDVPNASVMVVEHAERFGLAQLHQLRGRVGRGAQQSYCLLLSSRTGGRTVQRANASDSTLASASLARQRLEALVKSNDGFVIAEADLRIRGPGEFFGFRQWGMPEFRAANLIRDADLLQQARQEASALLKQDPLLAVPQHRTLKAAMLRRWQAKLDLGSVS